MSGMIKEERKDIFELDRYESYDRGYAHYEINM